jgi:hypothetical protein
MTTPTTRVPDGMPKAVTLQLSKSPYKHKNPYKNKKTTVAAAAKRKVTPSLTRTQSRDYPEHNHPVSNKSDTNVGLESVPLSGASKSPSSRLNKLDSTDKNRTLIKNNYLDNTDSDTDSDDKEAIKGTSNSPSRRTHKLNSTDNNRASSFDNTDSDDDETIEGSSNYPSRRTNKLNSTDNNRASNKNNYFDNTDSDEDETIDDNVEREQTLVDDSNFEGENVNYETDACSLEYNENNVDVNDEIMDDEEDTSHQGAGSARTVAKQSIPPLPNAPTRLFPPPPVIDLTVFNNDDDDRRGDDNYDDDNDDDADIYYTPFDNRKKRAVCDGKKKAVPVDFPDHILSQQLAHVTEDEPTVQEWNRIMDNYQEEDYTSEMEAGISTANNESTSDNNKIYYQHISQRLSKSRLDAMRFDPFPVAGTMNHDDKEQDPYVIQMKITLEDNNTRNMFNIQNIMGKGKWGFPLSQANCYDLDRYSQLVKPGQKAFANTRTVLRKIVRVVVTLDEDKQKHLLELARPGGLYIFIVQPEVLRTFLQHFSAHNSTSSVCNYIIQVKSLIAYFWECHSVLVMDRLKHIGQETTEDQMYNTVAICGAYLSTNHRAGKRQLTGERYVAQGEREKLNNIKLPDMVGYRGTLEKLDTFLSTAYPKVLIHLHNKLSIYHVGNKCLHQVVVNAAWAVREHFMFLSYAQQNGQYSWIKCSEFTLHLMVKSPAAGPNARVESKVESTVSLNQYSWNGNEAVSIESMIELTEVNPTRWYLEIRRRPGKVNKRIRDKTHPWHPWKLPNQWCVKYIIHYFTVLHPLINEMAKQKQLVFNQILAFSTPSIYRS